MYDEEFTVQEPCPTCGREDCICVHEDQGSLFDAPETERGSEAPPWA